MNEAVKICPECNAEYLARTTTCSDCGVALVRKTAVRDAQTPLPFSERLVEVQTETLPWVKKLAERLAKAGIRSHIRMDHVNHDTALTRTDYYHTLYVRPEDAEAAQRIDRDLLGHRDDESDASASTSEGRCPACGGAFTDTNHHCADCGLYLGPPES